MTARNVMRLALAQVIIATGVSLHAQSQTPPTTPVQNPAPPAPTPPAQAPTQEEPLVIGRDRVTAPRPISQVTPNYTPEAMRNRIQGVVRLRAIVERDGTVSGVEVLNSLDSMYGLDQAAIDALKQWRFQPGMVDGNPVRVAISVGLNFTLRDSAPPQAWPAGFSATTLAPDAVQEMADAQGLRLTVSRPAGWTIRRDGPPVEWVGVRAGDGLVSLSVFRPEGASTELHWPVSDEMVRRVAESVRRVQAGSDVETIAVGQIQAAKMFWVWSALKIPTVQTPPGTPANAFPVAEARIWRFTGTVNGKLVGVLCTLLLPRGLGAADIDARVQHAADDFAAIINSITIEALPN